MRSLLRVHTVNKTSMSRNFISNNVIKYNRSNMTVIKNTDKKLINSSKNKCNDATKYFISRCDGTDFNGARNL